MFPPLPYPSGVYFFFFFGFFVLFFFVLFCLFVCFFFFAPIAGLVAFFKMANTH